MLVEITPGEAKRIHYKAMKEHGWLIGAHCIWLRSNEEYHQAVSDQTSIMNKMEVVIRAAGEWDEYIGEISQRCQD